MARAKADPKIKTFLEQINSANGNIETLRLDCVRDHQAGTIAFDKLLAVDVTLFWANLRADFVRRVKAWKPA